MHESWQLYFLETLEKDACIPHDDEVEVYHKKIENLDIPNFIYA